MENLQSIFSQNNSVTSLSYQDFQETLTSWLHDNGVLTELRLQLRFKLLNLLKNKMIGRDVYKKKPQCTSLYNQAVNLIVAEYLLQKKCYYSLSIFNTEAPFTSVLPECSVSFNEMKQNRLCNYFSKENILQILDLIGLSKANPHYDKLLGIYYNSQENKSILCSLITLICQSPKVNVRQKYEKTLKNLYPVYKGKAI